MGIIEHRICRPVDHRHAVMIDQRIEGPVPDHLPLHVDPPHGKTDRHGETLFLQPEKLVQRATDGGNFRQVTGMFGIMKMQKLNMTDAKPFETFLYRPARPVAVETAGVHVTVEFRRNDDIIGNTTKLGERRPNPRLAATEPVIVRRVETVHRPVEDRPQGGQRQPIIHLVAVGVRHVPKAGGAEHERREVDPSGANPAAFHGHLRSTRPRPCNCSNCTWRHHPTRGTGSCERHRWGRSDRVGIAGSGGPQAPPV